MRISDWSSDVCSSDLRSALSARAAHRLLILVVGGVLDVHRHDVSDVHPDICCTTWRCVAWCDIDVRPTFHGRPAITSHRSEEHTSELQSLMRTTYAVFYLKKKITHKSDNHTATYNKIIRT